MIVILTVKEVKSKCEYCRCLHGTRLVKAAL